MLRPRTTLTQLDAGLADSKELGISNLANGYKDLIGRIDIDTFRMTPHEPRMPFFMITFVDPDTNEPLHACPRGLLEKVTKQLKQAGFEAYAGAEVCITLSLVCLLQLTVSQVRILQFQGQ